MEVKTVMRLRQQMILLDAHGFKRTAPVSVSCRWNYFYGFISEAPAAVAVILK